MLDRPERVGPSRIVAHILGVAALVIEDGGSENEAIDGAAP